MIRPAKLEEIDEILVMTRACAARMIAQGIYQWNEHYPSREAFEKDVERGELFILVEDSIIGCIVISPEMDEEYKAIDWITADGNNYYIHRVAVHPNEQGKGRARHLMDFAEDHIRNLGGVSVRLDTFSQNSRNQRFYEARGYQRLGNVYFPKQSDHPFYCYELVLSEEANE